MDPSQIVGLLKDVGPMVAAAGGAWFGLKASVNGMRQDITEIKDDVKALRTSDSEQNERIGVVEATVRSHHGWIRDVADRIERRREPRE